MNQCISINDIINGKESRYHIYYYANNKPRVLKKNSVTSVEKSITRLMNQGIKAYIVVDLIDMKVTPSNYTVDGVIVGNHLDIMKFSDTILFYNVGPKPYYEEIVKLTSSSFIVVNREKCTYATNESFEELKHF